MKLKRFTTQLAAAGLIALPWMAHAAGLGKLSVTSALGQPLSAEIELYAADKAELESISATLASDQAFREAHVDFAPVLSSLRFSVEKKANGKSVLKVTSNRPVNDPFIDMLIELNWASGKLVREYTLLLDPPGVAAPQTVAPVAVAPVKPVKPAVAPAPAPVAVASQAPSAASAAANKAPASPSPRPDRVTVKRGDTLISIAKRVRPESVSLEQTLVGLYRDNTKAFDGNINRLKAGKTLAVPSVEALASVSQTDAARELKLQADDWRAYRQKLAASVTAAPAPKVAPAQASSGKITPKVEDKAKPVAQAQQDVLKLSKAAPPVTAAKDDTRALKEKLRAQEEDAIARQKALEESDQRVAMLEKQIQDMRKLVEMKEKAQQEKSAPAAAPAVPAPTVVPAPAPEKKTATAPVVAAPAPEPEPLENWYDPLLADPLYWGGGLAALGLGGVLWWMMAGGARRRKSTHAALEDSIITGGDVRPDTVIGNAAGGSVNTGDTSFLTDFSQAGLGTIDTHDVDPIAEAEVYMAYGRDAQAEEILKEAISKNPDRHEIRVKLLEIYAARRNTTAFEAVAGELYAALGSKSSPLWDRACEMGRGIDPTNPLYGGVQSGTSAAPAATVAATSAVAGGAVAFDTELATAETVVDSAPAFQAHAAEDIAPEPMPEIALPEPEAEPAPLAFEAETHTLDFDLPSEPAAAPAAEAVSAISSDAGYEEMDTQGLAFDLPDLDIPAAAGDDVKLDLGLGLEEDNGPDSKFDFSGLDLDLGDAGGDDLELDEVGTKLDLARAYVEMGDKEGAREILNEVLGEGNDKQKADAKGMLAALG